MPWIAGNVEVTAEQAIMSETGKVFRKVRKMAEQQVLSSHKEEVDKIVRDIAGKIIGECQYI